MLNLKIGFRAVMLIPVCKSRWSVNSLKHRFLGSAYQDSKPVGLSNFLGESF